MGNTAKLDPACSQLNAMNAADAAILFPYVWYEPTLRNWKSNFPLTLRTVSGGCSYICASLTQCRERKLLALVRWAQHFCIWMLWIATPLSSIACPVLLLFVFCTRFHQSHSSSVFASNRFQLHVVVFSPQSSSNMAKRFDWNGKGKYQFETHFAEYLHRKNGTSHIDEPEKWYKNN